MITGRRQKFILEYLSDEKRNGARAAIKAGYAPPSAKVSACKILKDPEVQREIERQFNKPLRKLQVNTEMVLSGIISSIEKAEAAGEGAWQLAAIQRGYELLGKYLGMWQEKIEVGIDDKIMQQLAIGRLRAAGLLPVPADAEEPTANETPPEGEKKESKPN